MPAGRPTKYTEDFLKVARDYLVNFESVGDSIPSIAGLAVVSGINRDTLHTWAKEEGKEEFSDILGDILAKQEKTLINKGLEGDFNSTIVKLVLGKHGYHEKVDSNVDAKIDSRDTSAIDVLRNAIANASKSN